jgi:hypothetical protein
LQHIAVYLATIIPIAPGAPVVDSFFLAFAVRILL